MTVIRNDNDLRLAYEALHLVEKYVVDYNEKVVAKVKETKKAIRQYRDRPDQGARVLESDFDSMTALIPLPEDIDDMEDAEYYFDHYLYRECAPSMYDCTGQIFTVWHRIIKRNGRFWCYHRTAMDV